jgi:hypothetical protein
MGSASFSVRYRPARIGFLVRDGRIEDLERAAELNTLLWGGIYNPIVPVGAGNDTISRQLIELFGVDVLYAVGRDEQIERLLESNQQLTSPIFRELLYEDWHSKKNIVGYLDSLNIVQKGWEKEFKHSPDDYVSNCTFLRWEDRDPLNVLFVLQFGRFPLWCNLMDDFEAAFRGGMRAREIVVGLSDTIDPKVATSVTSIRLTELDLQGHGTGFHSGAGLYVGDATEFTDLVSFWNLRAAGYPILFVPTSHVDRIFDLAAEHVAWLDKLPHAHPDIEDWITFHYRADERRCREIANRFSTKKHHALS